MVRCYFSRCYTACLTLAWDLLQINVHGQGHQDPETHEILKNLAMYSANEQEYVKVAEVMRAMLHPDMSARATVEQVLKSPFFS